MSNENQQQNHNNSKPKPQWIEITSLSIFTTKWSLFSSFKTSFGNVFNVTINEDKRTAKVLFSNLESAQKCCNYYSKNPMLDGERIRIDLCNELNITKRNAKKCNENLRRKLNGFPDTDPGNSIIDKIKYCPENLEKLTPLFISRFHAKILRELSFTNSTTHKKQSIFVTDAFSHIGIDAYCLSDYFHTINALNCNNIFYSNLTSNIKLFGRYGTPIKCYAANFYNIYNNLCQHIIYIDSFHMNNNNIKWNDCCPDIAYYNNNQTGYLSKLCNDIYINNEMKMKNKNNNGNNIIVPLMLIAVKVPKHFLVAEFQEKINNCHIISFDFRYHQLMVLDFIHNINELRSLEFKCKNKKYDLGFTTTFIHQRDIGNNNRNIPMKKRKLNNINKLKDVNENDIAGKVKHKLKEIGFQMFGIEHTRNFKEKLKIQIYSKQLIRQVINDINLQAKFCEINSIDSFIENDSNNLLWIAPHIIGPRFIIYATAQWVILVDKYQNMYYHPTFNEFYQKLFFNTNDRKTYVTIMDGFLIPTNYFNNKKNESVSPLQFWILDVLSYHNNTSVVLRDRFKYFQNIVKIYNNECKYLNSGPISIHSLHFEEYKNRNNLLKFIKSFKDKQLNYNQCMVYENNEGHMYSIDGFVVIKNNTPCVIHNRSKYGEQCALWKCNFNALLTQYFIHKRNQTKSTSMFQNCD